MKWPEGLRQLKAKWVRRNISEKPIIILASRRGGSTVLADVIASNRGVWFANEPFAVFPSHPDLALKQRLLPYREHSQYFDLEGHELEQFRNYVSGLLRAEYSSLGRCRRVKFPFHTNRVCLKILNAPWMLNWFLDNAKGDVIFLTRHPAAQALSVNRQEWDYGVRAYFSRPHALAKVFSSDQIAFGLDILNRNNKWEVAILDWIMTTHHGRASKDPRLIKVAYEHMVVNPTSFCEDILCRRLKLSELERMKARFGVPSNSSSLTTQSTLDAIAAGDKEKLLSDWTRQIGDEEKRTAQAILDRFNVVEYDMSHHMPLGQGCWETR